MVTISEAQDLLKKKTSFDEAISVATTLLENYDAGNPDAALGFDSFFEVSYY